LASDLAKVFNTTAEIPSAPVTGITPLDQTVPSSSSQTDAGQTSATVKSLEEVMGEPNLRSTPVSSPNLKSRFDVQKVIEKRLSLGLNIGAADQHRRESLLSEGRVSPEAEHYDSSPSPGSCYDTASESVEPGVNIVEPMSQLSLENAVSQTLATSLYSWPSTWPESTSLTNTWQDSGTTRSREEHHASGDSIPVGCEASHLDTSHDSGLASFTQTTQGSPPSPRTAPGPVLLTQLPVNRHQRSSSTLALKLLSCLLSLQRTLHWTLSQWRRTIMKSPRKKVSSRAL